MSKQAIEDLKPELLWHRFYELSQIPRPSKKEEKVIEYLGKLASKLGLKAKIDEVGNICISLPASKGYENAPGVILQAHVDMVCEKNKGTDHNFDSDPIKLKRENGWITAEGTTLGADNGIGAAAALAILSDESVIHGPLECLFTVDEETGLTGVNNLQPGFVSGKILLNLDSEEDGAFYIGCAGGQDTLGIYNISYEDTPPLYRTFHLTVNGLKGGHSGMDISSGRGNAIKLLARALKSIENLNYCILHIEGGSKRNAIAREAEAVLALDMKSADSAKILIEEFEKDVQNEYKSTDSGLRVNLSGPGDEGKQGFSRDFAQKIISVILGLPHGVISMSPDIPGLVETSTNLATVTLEGKNIKIGTSQRSSIESAKHYIANSVEAIFKLSGAEVSSTDGYPGWKPNLNSELLKTAKQIYLDMFGQQPEIKAIHAGLECGILGDKYPGMDMISFGPAIEGAHSPDEKVNIQSTEKFYSLLKEILGKLAQ